jgi:hypothetical protein
MAFYEFQCIQCNIVFEKRLSFAEYDEAKNMNFSNLTCQCGSNKIEKKFTGFPAFVGATDLKNFNHDYRFWTNRENVQHSREEAEKKSHVGPTPYSDNVPDAPDHINF